MSKWNDQNSDVFSVPRSYQASRVTHQPQGNVSNSFNVFNGENLIQNWQFDQGCCGCGGTHFVTVTDQRLLTRFEEYSACKCCCEPARADSAIYLFDIAQLATVFARTAACGGLCSGCCCCCKKVGPNSLYAFGAFPTHQIIVSSAHSAQVKHTISEAIGYQKPNARRH